MVIYWKHSPKDSVSRVFVRVIDDLSGSSEFQLVVTSLRNERNYIKNKIKCHSHPERIVDSVFFAPEHWIDQPEEEAGE